MLTKDKPQRVSKHNKCRICDKTDWCVYFEDGGALCQRIPGGVKETANGAYYYPPENSDKQDRQEQGKPLPEAQVKQFQMADLETRDRVYRDFLTVMPISPEHMEHLETVRRIPKAKQVALHFGTLWGQSCPDGLKWRDDAVESLAEFHNLEGIPGFYKDTCGKWRAAGKQGLLVPYKAPNGMIQGFQIRTDCGDPKYMAFSSNNWPWGTPAKAFRHHTHAIDRLDMWICEGALKATVASELSDEAFIGLFGLRIANLIQMVQGMNMIPRFILAPDADWRTNKQVHQGWLQNVRLLERAGLRFRIADWPPEQGKGIDDYLISAGTLPSHADPKQWEGYAGGGV